MWCSTLGCLVTLTLGLLVAPLLTVGQPAGKVYRIGWLTSGVLPVTPLLEALRILGYIDGHHLMIEQRHAETPASSPPSPPSWWHTRWTSS